MHTGHINVTLWRFRHTSKYTLKSRKRSFTESLCPYHLLTAISMHLTVQHAPQQPHEPITSIQPPRPIRMYATTSIRVFSSLMGELVVAEVVLAGSWLVRFSKNGSINPPISDQPKMKSIPTTKSVKPISCECEGMMLKTAGNQGTNTIEYYHSNPPWCFNIFEKKIHF